MNILINGATLQATKAFPFEHANGKRELRVTIPQSEVEYSVLKELLNANEGEIVLTKDDGTTQTFVGYKTTYEITDKTENEVAVWYVVIYCTAEAERRAWEAQQKATALEQTVAEQAMVISAQAEMIAVQTEQVAVLEEATAMQVETIESILLDVIPATIAEAVAEAFEAQNSATPVVE